MRVPLARSPPAWRIACRKGPESALIHDVLCQRRFVQHRRLEVDLGCRSCHGHPAFLSRLSSPAVRAWLLPASRRWQQAPQRLGPATLGVVQPDRWALTALLSKGERYEQRARSLEGAG